MRRGMCMADCEKCPSKESCPGCVKSDGCPFGKECRIARYIKLGGLSAFAEFKHNLIDEINALKVDGMARVTELYPLVGRFVNLEYPLPSGEKVKLLRDDEMYLGAQVESIFDSGRKHCFGVIAEARFLLICEYGENCDSPEIVLFKRR